MKHECKRDVSAEATLKEPLLNAEPACGSEQKRADHVLAPPLMQFPCFKRSNFLNANTTGEAFLNTNEYGRLEAKSAIYIRTDAKRTDLATAVADPSSLPTSLARPLSGASVRGCRRSRRDSALRPTNLRRLRDIDICYAKGSGLEECPLR